MTTTTATEWHAVNLFTGEIGPAVEPPRKQRRADVAFVALVKLCGYEGQPLTDSLRGACNKAASEIKKAEREANDAIALDDIAAMLNDFGAWFKKYRRDRFNEVCARSPYPMETAKLWPEYRKAQSDKSRAFSADRERYEYARQLRGDDENAI
jgi:hypothetical protein